MNYEQSAEAMTSPDYKERFKAEYIQLKVRCERLAGMLEKWGRDELDFTPSCSRELLEYQLACMEKYKNALEKRAQIEKIDLKE